ncbi:MAG: hypothetical protein K2H85_11105, partial [Allobaculum sp.]|nr:hypothetical protein [Allobaculum sp.]
NISNTRIENKLADYFYELKTSEKSRTEKISASLKQLTESIINLTDKKSINQLESIFQTLTNELLRKQNASIYEELNRQTAKNIESYVQSCFMYTPRIGEAMYDVQNNTRRILNKYCENLMEEYCANMRAYLNRYQEQTLEVIKSHLKDKARKEEQQEAERKNQELRREQENKVKRSISANEIQFISPNLKKFGIIIEDTFDGFTIKTANNEKSMPLSKDANGLYFSEDHSIEFQDFGSDGIMVTIGNNVIRETKDSCYFGTRDNPSQTQITMDFLDYKIIYSGITQTDLIKKGVILDDLARNFPDYYAHISGEPVFNSLRNEIEAAKKNQEDLYLDESLVVHINPNNRESFIDKMSVLDLSVAERGDGVYVIEPNGLEHHLLYSSGYAYFEDNPKIGFNTNFYSITDKGIMGPQIDLHVGNTTLTISTDYLFMTLSDKNQLFRLGYDSINQFVCEAIINNKVIRNNGQLKEVFKKASPKAYERVKATCIAYEEAMKNGEEKKEETQEQPSTSNQTEIIQEAVPVQEGTNKLLEELAAEEQVEKINIEETNNIGYGDIQVVEDTALSIEDELFVLEQDPNVQRYIELMKLQEEQNAMNQD